MSLTKFNEETNNIQSLPDKPTLLASELKGKFDKTGDDLKTYINETLTAEIDTELEKKANNSNVYTKAQSNTNFKANGDFTVISGSHLFNGTTKYFNIPYPSGFNKDNSVIISTGKQYNERNILVNLLDDVINVQQDNASATTYIYKIVLMKV